MKLLKKNQKRELDNVECIEEEEEKHILSLYIAKFFKQVSLDNDTRSHLKEKKFKKYFKECLYYEHNKVLNNIYRKIPILIEDTEIGVDIEALLSVISPKHALEGYNYVSFRIMHKLANTMSNKPYKRNIDYLNLSQIKD